MFGTSRIAAVLRAAGFPLRQAAELADVLGRKSQGLQTGGGLQQDTTPRDIRQVTPDARRHHLTNLDFRRGDPDYRHPKVDDSERRRSPEPDPAVKSEQAPQETDATYSVVDGAYTNVVGSGGAVAVNLSVTGSGRAMILDPAANHIVGKTLRCEAAGGGNNQSLVRFFIDETDQEVVWKLQLAIDRFPIVKKVRYDKGRGIVATVQTAAVFLDPTDREREEVIKVYEQEVVSALDPNVAGTDLIATKVKVDVLGTADEKPDRFTFGGAGSPVKLCKTMVPLPPYTVPAPVWQKDEWADLPVYGGTPLYETPTGEVIRAYNKIGRVLPEQWVYVTKSVDNNEWYLIEAEKEPTSIVWKVEVVTSVVSGVTKNDLVFFRRKFFAQALEEDDPIIFPLTECVTPYDNPSGGGGGGSGGGGGGGGGDGI